MIFINKKLPHYASFKNQRTLTKEFLINLHHKRKEAQIELITKNKASQQRRKS